jgi:hypothetical protein
MKKFFSLFLPASLFAKPKFITRVVKEPVLTVRDIDRFVTKAESSYLKKGSVILVRSDYKYEKYGDHFSLIVGGRILKDRGMRPNLITFAPSNSNTEFLNELEDTVGRDNGAIVVLVRPEAAQKVLDAYGIHLSEGEITEL